MISVCMATYNGAVYIKEQLESILSQIGPEDEIVISDDGSTDATLDVVAALNEPRIQVFANTNHGYVHNFENAISHAKGDYIFLSDQDDIWHPNKVKRCLEVLQEYWMLNHNSELVNQDAVSMGKDFFSLHHSSGGYWQTLWRNSYSGCCMAFRREVLDYALPFPPRVAAHDIWLGLIAEKHGRCCFLNEKLVYYRRHEHNASTTSEPTKFSLWKQLQYRLYMFVNSLQR